MRRPLILATVLLAFLPGCQQANARRMTELNRGFYSTESMERYVLCGYAMDAVRLIVRELMAAPNNDAALTRQTVASYTAYATTLRGLADQTAYAERRDLILDAADAADAYAAEVKARDDFHVDVQPVIDASQEAFPGCNLGS